MIVSSIESAPVSIPATSTENFASALDPLVRRDAQPLSRQLREPQVLRESQHRDQARRRHQILVSMTANTPAGGCFNCVYEMPFVSEK